MMRILFALPYGPSVTRVRSRMLLRELTRRIEVVVLALAWDAADRAALDALAAQGVVVHTVPHPWGARVQAAAGDPRRPLQQIVSTSPAFAAAARRLIDDAARRGRPFDAVHVEHLRGAAAIDLPSGLDAPVVFDAVDCISTLARLTAVHGPSRAARLVARVEHARTMRFEARCIAAADVVTVVAERDRAGLAQLTDTPDAIAVIPNGVDSLPAPIAVTAQPRAIFAGKLSYHANQAAARRLLAEIWPRVRARVPEATLTIAGAGPPRWLRAAHGKDGVEVVADPPDLLELVAAARVALAPLVYSVGVQNKVLEAMGRGVPVVATGAACDGLPDEARGCIAQADDPEAFAEATRWLMTDLPEARRIGRLGHAYARRNHAWETIAERFRAMYAPAGVVRSVA